MARLKDLYQNTIKTELEKSLGITNVMAVPRIEKVVVNAGVGRAVADSKKLEEAEEALTTITGQAPIKNKAKKSIAGFKLREGMPVGVSVTLRGERMYEFIDRLVNTALPRVRDFRGINPKAFDGQGNYSLGIKEHTVFPELIGKDVTAITLQVNVQTTAKNDEEGRELLKAFGFPFTKESK
jgi:large subunit ribosomal protein L5